MRIKENVLFKAAIFALILGLVPAFVVSAQNIDNVQAALNRGEEAVRSGDYDRAVREFTESIRLTNALIINSNARQATLLTQMLGLEYQLRGFAYYLKDDYDNGIADYTESIKYGRGEDEDTYYYRGRLYTGKEDWDRAIADYTQVIRLNPQKTEAFFYRGNAYYYKNDFNRAIADWESLLRLDPNNENARRNIEIVKNQQQQRQ